MPCMYTFCTWFSVRLGSLMVGIFSLVQSVMLLLFSVIFLLERELIEELCSLMLNNCEVLFYDSIFVLIQNHSKLIFTTLIIFFAIHFLSCIFLIYGSFQLKIWQIIPFIIFEFMRLALLSYLQLAITLLIKSNIMDFNVLITFIITSGFMLLLLYYLWLCPLSLIQCIQTVKTANNKIFPNGKGNFKAESMLQYYDYLSRDFGMKPIQPHRNLYQYQYRYNNMPALVF